MYFVVLWESIGGLENVKARLQQAVEWPLQHAGAFQRLGLTAPRGILLHGPPGQHSLLLTRTINALTASCKSSRFVCNTCLMNERMKPQHVA